MMQMIAFKTRLENRTVIVNPEDISFFMESGDHFEIHMRSNDDVIRVATTWKDLAAVINQLNPFRPLCNM